MTTDYRMLKCGAPLPKHQNECEYFDVYLVNSEHCAHWRVNGLCAYRAMKLKPHEESWGYMPERTWKE